MRIRNSRASRAASVVASAFVLAGILPLIASAQSAAPAQTTAAQKPAAADTKDLPAARQIIDRHIEAVGGRKAIMARNSSHQTGTMSVPAQGLTAEIEAFAAKPNKVMVRIKVPGIGEVSEGFDGTHGWSINPMTGPMLNQGKELEQKKFDSDFYAELYDESRYTSMKSVEKTTFNGRPVHKVSLVKKDGGEDFEFFDVETGLKAGRQVTRDTPMGQLSVTVTLADYKKFGDLLVATTMKQSVMGVEQVFTTTSVEYDKVDPAVFDLPPAIKALIK